MNRTNDAAVTPRGAPWLTWAALGVVLLGAVLNLWYVVDDCPLDLAGDEAHYWEWSRRLDLSYYSKGPLVAYIIAAGRFVLADWSRYLLGNEELAVRGPAIGLSILTGIGMIALARVTTRDRRVALAAVALPATIPILAVGGKLMTIDAPLACLWTWTLVALTQAFRRDALVAWVGAGVLIALGILAKYNMVFIYAAAGALLLIEPGLRRYWRRPGPYVAAGVGLLGFVPILLWNVQNGWVSFRHVAGQAGVAGGPTIDPLGPFAYVAGQAGVANVLWLVPMVWAGIALWRRPAADERIEPWVARWLVITMFLPWLVFLGFSPITKIQPNWPVLALTSGVVVLPYWLMRRLEGLTPAQRRGWWYYLAGAAVFGLVQVVLIHFTAWLMPLFALLTRNAPPWEKTPIRNLDPTARLRGWSQLGSAVGSVLAAEQAVGRDPFIMTDDYQVASEIAFYCPGNPPVYSAQAALGGRYSQYDLWMNPISDPELFVGRPCIYVGSVHPELTGEGGGAAALPGLGEPTMIVTHEVRGHPMRIWTIFTAPSFAGFEVSEQRAERY